MTRNHILSLALTLACGAAFASPATAQDSARVERPTSDYITREQIVSTRATNVYDIVEALHSNWLNERLPIPQSRTRQAQDTTGKGTYNADMGGADNKSMAGGAGGIQVYVDGTRVGAKEELKNLTPNDIASVRRINGTDAQARFGVGHSSGVIYVVTTSYASKSKP